MHIERTTNATILARLTQGTHDLFAEKYPHFFKPFVYEDAIKYYEVHVADDNNEFYVLYDLYDGNEMTGFIWVIVDEHQDTHLTKAYKSLYVKKVVVHKNFRQRGYGKELIWFVERLAKERACTLVEVELWYSDEIVVNFLRSQNFNLLKGIVWKNV